MGPGWATPFAIVVADANGPITTSRTLSRLARFQQRIGDDPRVASVAGPGAFVAQTADLKKLPKALEDSKDLLTGGKKDLADLEAGLGEAGDGALQLQTGLIDASNGAQQLSSGDANAQAGAAKLESGLANARAGSKKISSGLSTALDRRRVAEDRRRAGARGSDAVSTNLGAVADPVT